ncbi:ATP-dependent DNA helicase srs2, partial [Marasmius crinis-equi]
PYNKGNTLSTRFRAILENLTRQIIQEGAEDVANASENVENMVHAGPPPRARLPLTEVPPYTVYERDLVAFIRTRNTALINTLEELNETLHALEGDKRRLVQDNVRYKDLYARWYASAQTMMIICTEAGIPFHMGAARVTDGTAESDHLDMPCCEGARMAYGDNPRCRTADLTWIVEQGTFPFHRSDDMEEERRILYLACTRAQSLLYMSHASTRKVGGDVKPRDLSTFVESVTEIKPSLFTERLPVILHTEREVRVLDPPDATRDTMKTSRRQEASVDWNTLPEGVIPDANFVSSSTSLVCYPRQNDTERWTEEYSPAMDDAHMANAEQCMQGRSACPAKKKVGGFWRPVAALDIQQRQQSTSLPMSSSAPSEKGSNVTIDVAFPSHGPAVPYSRSTTPKTFSNKQDLMLKPALPLVLCNQNVSFMPTSRPVTEPYSNAALGHPPRTISNNQNLTPTPAPLSVPKLVFNDQHVSFEPASRPMLIPNAPPKVVADRKPNHAPLQTTSNLISPATYSDGLPHPQPPSLPNADPVASSSPSQSSGPNKVPSGQIIGVKRRLGMGRVMGGYQNKKFRQTDAHNQPLGLLGVFDTHSVIGAH